MIGGDTSEEPFLGSCHASSRKSSFVRNDRKGASVVNAFLHGGLVVQTRYWIKAYANLFTSFRVVGAERSGLCQAPRVEPSAGC